MRTRKTAAIIHWRHALATLSASLFLLLSALAQTGNQPPPSLVLRLKCTPNQGEAAAALLLTNTSGLMIPAHKPIFIITDTGKVAASYPEPFSPNTSRYATGPPGKASATCQAYFYK